MNARIDLWFARDAGLRHPSLVENFSRMLAPEERARMEGMHFPEHRHQQLVTRAMARSVLTHYVPEVAPADWRFERNDHGRPRIALGAPASARDLNFNLAHTEGLVVMAVARSADIANLPRKPPQCA